LSRTDNIAANVNIILAAVGAMLNTLSRLHVAHVKQDKPCLPEDESWIFLPKAEKVSNDRERFAIA